MSLPPFPLRRQPGSPFSCLKVPAAWRHGRSGLREKAKKRVGRLSSLLTSTVMATAVLCNKYGMWATRLGTKRLRMPIGWTKS